MGTPGSSFSWVQCWYRLWECSVAKSTNVHGSDGDYWGSPALLFPSGIIPPKGLIFALSFSRLGGGVMQVKRFLDFSMQLCSVFEPRRVSVASLL